MRDLHIRCGALGGERKDVPFPVRIALVGTEPEVLQRWAEAVVKQMAKEAGFADAEVDSPPDEVKVDVQVDREAAERMGVASQDVADARVLAAGGVLDTPRVQLRLDGTGSPVERLADTQVRATGGKMVPLSAVARVVTRIEPEVFRRFNHFPALRITASPAGSQSVAEGVAQALKAAAATREQAKVPADYQAADDTVITD